MPVVRGVLAGLVLTTLLAAKQTISFPTEDHGRVCADLYGTGERAVVLAHGGRFTKESWRAQAPVLASRGFAVLAIDFRGFGCSTGRGEKDFDTAPFYNDVLAAVSYLKTHGAKTVSVVGGSFGGAAAGDASIKSAPGLIDRVVFLGAAPNLSAEKLRSRTLFIVAQDDANSAGLRLPQIQSQYQRAPQPKELIVLPGSAHAQFLFRTNQADRIMQDILRFLSLPSLTWAAVARPPTLRNPKDQLMPSDHSGLFGCKTSSAAPFERAANHLMPARAVFRPLPFTDAPKILNPITLNHLPAPKP